MKVIFSGGANEVGASCYLINLEGKNILLDCGIRMSSTKDNLPDFRLIQEHGGVDAIIVSHAHLDHAGTLPIISRMYPRAKIYMTHATKDLTRVLLYDSLKIMERESEIPIYAENHVKDMLDRILCYTPGYTFTPFSDSQIKVTLYPAGHILGAASVYITSEEGSVFYSGDFSGFRQNTIEGAFIPKLRPDVAIFESTYGDKLHANRELEETRLIEKVSSIISEGGKVIIPAFALGRAQEIILILKKAINKGLLKTKVYVDGMVREVCRVYKLNPNYLRQNLAKKIFNGNDIFFDDNIIEVEKPEMREEIIKESCVIISSSGMITGGPSQWYVEKLAQDEKNLIAITGYQDEESPGRQLLDIIEESTENRKIKIDDKEILINASIDKFGLSAHADMGEILALASSLYPKKIFLVHGDPEIINFLGKEIQKDLKSEIYIPSNGDIYEIDIKNPRKQIEKQPYPSMNQNCALTQENIKDLWQFIVEKIGVKQALSLEEIAQIWGKGVDTENLKELLNNTIYFEPDKKRMFLYYAVTENELKNLQKDEVMELNQMLSLADEYFGPESGLYKKGARFEEKIALLYFNFPDVARERYSEKFKEFEEKTGWKIELNKNINISAINSILSKILPKEILIKKVSYMNMGKKVIVKIEGKINDLDLVKDKFYSETGLTLLIANDKEGIQNEKKEIIMANSNFEDRMEQNKALKIIDEEFSKLPHKIYKKSIKTSSDGYKYIELSFISKVVGEKYTELIKKLSEKTGWPIGISDSCNQFEIINIVKNLFEEKGILLKKNPSIYMDNMIVKIITSSPIEKETLEEINEKLYYLTGFKVEML
ncbi:MBL fold metallo-hydrolase [Thermoanaerobacter uzonensis]|uniref:MBL fold metallo-hydrolase n=1 Tax=Thermoanaerobacter uzonensis TaxID=447593 RepID=UPI003D768B14